MLDIDTIKTTLTYVPRTKDLDKLHEKIMKKVDNNVF